MAPKKRPARKPKEPTSATNPKEFVTLEELAERRSEQAKKRARKLEIKEINKELERIQKAGDAAKKRAATTDDNEETEETVQRETERKKQTFIESRLMVPVTLATTQQYDYSNRVNLLLVIPDDCTIEEQIEAYETRITEFYIDLVKKMDAFPRTFSWYLCPLWLQWYGKPGKAQGVVYQNVQKHFTTARVYYLPHFVAKMEIPRFLSAVPAICSRSDGIIQLQSSFSGPRPDVYDSRQYDPSTTIRTGWLREPNKHSAWTQNSDHSKTFENLSQAINACPRLLNIFERRRSRMKCIASSIGVFATHGCSGKGPQPKKSEHIHRNIIAITGAAPQFAVSYLDYADFIFEEDAYPSRLECYQILGQLSTTWTQLKNSAIYDERNISQKSFHKLPGGRFFHVAGYLQTMKDSFFLWLRAFDDQVRQRSVHSKGYLQIPAMGCDSASLSLPGKPEVKDFAEMLMPLLVQAIEETLEDNYFPNIIKIGFCDSSGKALFSPTKDYIQHINLVPCPGQNLCQFDDEECFRYACGLLVPGNSFSLPGNELGYDSIEAEVGMNTSLRIVQNYIHNKNLLDPRNHIAVDGPCMLFEGREANVKVPCIISDTTSVQDYTWTGVPQPAITGNIEREGSSL